MSLSRAKNIFMPANMNSTVLLPRCIGPFSSATQIKIKRSRLAGTFCTDLGITVFTPFNVGNFRRLKDPILSGLITRSIS